LAVAGDKERNVVMDLTQRPRRLRTNSILRKMVRETRMDISSLVYPVFIKEGVGIEEEIKSMEGQFRYSIDRLPYKMEELLKAGVDKVLLFGIPGEKDEYGSLAYADKGIIQKALRSLKQEFPQLYCITDVCMCEYTSHGHCGILKGETVDNDLTLEYLAKIALSHAEAGADMVAPSDMMDGRIGTIRRILDGNQMDQISIMSYAVKYASAFYGPFREAAGSAPAFGDRKTYQMDYHNKREAIKEALLDIEEGADIIMVKPALSYHDVISEVSSAVKVPVAAYSVSGEYAMVKAAAKAGFIQESDILCEMAAGAYRAGANIYITYFAKELAGFISEGRIG
jgi:porphobilinogen synthase